MLHVNGVFVCCVVEVEDVGDREGFDQGDGVKDSRSPSVMKKGTKQGSLRSCFAVDKAEMKVHAQID